MTLQNRVNPFAQVVSVDARGSFMGNRGGRIHNDARRLGAQRWASRQWICCKLDFNNRHRTVWGEGYSELFFLDEVTAFAAGHRPCFECRRKDAEHFAALFSGVESSSAHSRVSENPESQSQRHEFFTLGPRLRGDERNAAAHERISAPMMDRILHAERLAGKAKRLHKRALDALPDGVMIAREDEAFAVRGTQLLRWTPAGYAEALPRPRGITVDLLTPPSTLAVLARGYAPLWHPSAH